MYTEEGKCQSLSLSLHPTSPFCGPSCLASPGIFLSLHATYRTKKGEGKEDTQASEKGTSFSPLCLSFDVGKLPPLLAIFRLSPKGELREARRQRKEDRSLILLPCDPPSSSSLLGRQAWPPNSISCLCLPLSSSLKGCKTKFEQQPTIAKAERRGERTELQSQGAVKERKKMKVRRGQIDCPLGGRAEQGKKEKAFIYLLACFPCLVLVVCEAGK